MLIKGILEKMNEESNMVSVIIPSYNRSGLIIRAVKSLLNQTYKNIEIIIVDDGSTDNTKEALANLKDDRIIYVQQFHQGACAARNLGIDTAKGEYIAFHDSDDICRLDRIEKQLNAIIKTNADMICGNVSFQNKNSALIRPNYPAGWIQSKDHLVNIPTMTFFAKAEVFKNIRFDPRMPRWQDLEILLRIHDEYKIYFINETLVDYYVQGDSITSDPNKCIKAFEYLKEKHPYIREQYKYLYGSLLKLYVGSKYDLGITDCNEELIDVYKCIKSPQNFVWFICAKLNIARWVYRLAKVYYSRR